uniref:Galactose oxidase-like Early set domain-containing protein n=1 Tax=Physcomitrium patens TaxID=3218 RepID=A0A2K1KMC7_PHYPA|nr:hypothetical protein PHYPA_005824 [Physcomitrium patens]PNR54932.1 hypothetical protein PHYPA_005825 [Physcomitrium patens]
MGLSKTTLVVLVTLQCLFSCAYLVAAQGSWALLNNNAGISSMHTAVTHMNTVIMLDRTNTGPSAIKLPNGRCRNQPVERISKVDCYVHSVMFNPGNNQVRPLYVYTDTWCSSGQFFDNGRMVQTRGDFEGNRKIRTLQPCGVGDNCDWIELGENLATGRWYSSNQLLPSDNNLYPFVYLLPNGDLFVFTNRNFVQLNWNSSKVVRGYPQILENPRNYPSAGSAVMLPLTWQTGFGFAQIMVCGGAAAGASNARNANAPASFSCGTIVASSGNPVWAMQNMPIRRVMGDMINLPTGDILIINGAQNGYQGWGKANNPALNPVNYNPVTKQFQIYAKTNIPRMYHSTANLLSDGRVLLAESNTHQFYTYNGQYPTDLRVEAFSPPYLGAGFNGVRPAIQGYPNRIKYKQVFVVNFAVGQRVGAVEVNMNSAPYLKTMLPTKAGNGWSVQVTAVPENTIAPPTYYLLFVVQNGIPSKGVWIKQNN